MHPKQEGKYLKSCQKVWKQKVLKVCGHVSKEAVCVCEYMGPDAPVIYIRQNICLNGLLPPIAIYRGIRN